jgi:transposase
VIDMELLSVIRRWHYRDHFSIREISRRTGLSRNTVRKYLRSDTVEPKFNIPDRPSKLDPYADKLSQMLRQEAGKSRKQKRTTKQLHADLAALGYDGSYNRVAAFARDWKAARRQEQQTCGRGVFVPLAFLPGEAFQFDWSEDWAIIAGERTKLQVAHVKLSYSRAFILRAYPEQTHEMLFDAHNHAFRVLGGVPRRGIYDNMRTAVDKVGRGKERQVNARFSRSVACYPEAASACITAHEWLTPRRPPFIAAQSPVRPKESPPEPKPVHQSGANSDSIHRSFYDRFKKILIDGCVVSYGSPWSSGESQARTPHSGRAVAAHRL